MTTITETQTIRKVWPIPRDQHHLTDDLLKKDQLVDTSDRHLKTPVLGLLKEHPDKTKKSKCEQNGTINHQKTEPRKELWSWKV